MSRKNISGLVLEPAFIWYEGRFQRNLKLLCSQDGKIEILGTAAPDGPSVKMPNQALLPGMVNTHSHAFHRALRDREETGVDFWSWRQNFYDLVDEMTPEAFYDVCKRAFFEMLRSGITTVGEFHYFHHSKPVGEQSGNGEDAESYDFDSIILQAAKDCGIRIVLLETFYERGGLKDQPLQRAQKHFISTSHERFWSNFAKLTALADPTTQSIGIAAHSVRAVSLESIRQLYEQATLRHLPFHMHLEEQQLEVSDCREIHGKDPVALMIDEIPIESNFTAVHATQTTTDNLIKLVQRGANLAICPLTEGCLGDGIPNWSEYPNTFVSIGSDCNNRICMTEELRWLCYCQQMQTHVRGLRGYPTPGRMFDIATKNGARSLGLDSCGELKEGNWCDFFTLDLTAECLKNADEHTLMKSFIYGSASDAVVNSACVAGQMQSFWQPSASIPSSLQQTFLTVSTKEHPVGTVKQSSPTSPAIYSTIEADTVDRLLLELMKFDSTSGREIEVAQALSTWLENRGWRVEKNYFGNEGRFNVIATKYQGVRTDIEVILNTHFDTVPPYIPPSEDGGMIKGRGACDAKGVLAAMVFGAEKFTATNGDKAAKIALIFVAGEEVDHVGAIAISKLGYKPKAVICGEPTVNLLANVQKGILKVNLKCSGKAGHSGYPQVGESAVEKLLDILQDVRNETWPSNEEFGKTTINFGLIKGGTAANVIPDYAEATLAFRLITPPEEIIDRLTKIVNGRSAIEVTSRSSPIVMDIKGEQAYPVPFNTDLGYLGLDSGVKKCLVGPGIMTTAHSPREYILVDDLHKAVDVYCDVIGRAFSS